MKNYLKGRLLPFVCAVPLLLCGSLAANAAGGPPADLVLYNGKVYTLDGANLKAEAVAAREGRIVFIGASSEAKLLIGPRTRAVNLKGATLLPGLTDSHCHLAGIGEGDSTLNLEGILSLKELLR
jgi:predicted amidohydrolase YtcJ